MKLGPVICQLCGKPVDEVVFSRDDSMAETVVIAFCHGEEDRMTIRDVDLKRAASNMEWRRAIERGGVAFRGQFIESDAEKTVQIANVGT